MHPVLLDLGFIKIYSYGFFVALAFIVGMIIIRFEAMRLKFDLNFIYDLVFVILISSILGARLLYILLNFSYYISNPSSMLKFWQGGMVFYGGMIAGTLAGIIYIKRKTNYNIFDIADMFAPVLILGHAIGRLGCFCAGCCYGKHTHSIFGVVFNAEHTLAPVGVKIHPTQIYEFLGNFLIFLLLWNLRKTKKFRGQIFALYILVYSIFRFFLEFLRGDDRGIFFFLSDTQAISIVLIILASWFLYAKSKNNNRTRI